MAEYALIDPEGQIVRTVELADDEPAPTISENKGAWVPVITSACDPATQAPGPLTVADGGASVVRPARNLTEDDLEALRAPKRLVISAEFQRRASATIPYTVAGVSKAWDADDEAITNISGVVLMIAVGVPVPNPRPWTAHGEMTPTVVSHAELIGLGAAIAARKDALFTTKKTLEAQLAALTDATAIQAFDPLAGWE